MSCNSRFWIRPTVPADFEIRLKNWKKSRNGSFSQIANDRASVACAKEIGEFYGTTDLASVDR